MAVSVALKHFVYYALAILMLSPEDLEACDENAVRSEADLEKLFQCRPFHIDCLTLLCYRFLHGTAILVWCTRVGGRYA